MSGLGDALTGGFAGLALGTSRSALPAGRTALAEGWVKGRSGAPPADGIGSVEPPTTMEGLAAEFSSGADVEGDLAAGATPAPTALAPSDAPVAIVESALCAPGPVNPVTIRRREKITTPEAAPMPR
jgi:hypothetical protein